MTIRAFKGQNNDFCNIAAQVHSYITNFLRVKLNVIYCMCFLKLKTFSKQYSQRNNQIFEIIVCFCQQDLNP